MSIALEKASQYESEREARIAPGDKPSFHLAARVGWMNDPNGLSYYNGQYHLFYQYHPYDSHWGPMHWGHAVSSDLLTWEYLPCAMAPDEIYDAGGCYSGSAIELPDGRHLLMYTGVSGERMENGRPVKYQTQCLAFGDGVNYRKYEGNPVISGKDLPEGASRTDFRDPKIWREADGTYRALMANDQIGTASADSGRFGSAISGSGSLAGGRMLLYESADLVNWKLRGSLAENGGRLGLMWECPDLFSLDGYDVLLGSAQDMLPKGFEYHNGNGTFYFLGHVDPETGRFIEESDHAIDYGIDFYAPQTILLPDGRRVMIGWMQNWDTCNLHTKSTPWFGQMSLPRELRVKNGILYQQPLKELEERRTEPAAYERVTIENQEMTLPGIAGRCADIELELFPDDELFNRFAIRFAQNDSYHTGVSFRPRESVLKVDRKFSGSRRAIIHQRRAKVGHERGHLKLRLILDRFSVEVFVNDGEKVMSATVATDPSADGISFFADGKLSFSIKYFRLK